jgi:hypothetical protein
LTLQKYSFFLYASKKTAKILLFFANI